MRIWVLILIAALLSGCTTEPKNPEAWLTRAKNGCLPTAITMAQSLRRQEVQAQVVRYSLRNGGHAICAYLYPPGKNILYTYDYEGSWRTRAYWADPMSIATAAERLRGRYEPVLSAEFLDK